jgi:hypothetical protein
MVANNVNIPSGSDKEFANWNFTMRAKSCYRRVLGSAVPVN